MLEGDFEFGNKVWILRRVCLVGSVCLGGVGGWYSF